MSNFQEELKEIELTIEQANGMLDRHESLKRLIDNKDFKELILEGFIEKEVIRAVGLLASAELMVQGDVPKKMCENILVGSGALTQYFLKIEQMGYSARDALANARETQVEVLQEQQDEIDRGTSE